jgi:hypothetical protein
VHGEAPTQRPGGATALPSDGGDRTERGQGGECLAPGSVLFGEYEILERVGQGGMGAADRARHRALGSLRAIKVMRDALRGDPLLLEFFLREAHALLALQHDAVVRCHDLLRDERGALYLVMEFAEGCTLAQRLSSGPLAAAEVWALGRRLLGALAAVHAREVIHRDLSPDNIVLRDGDPQRAVLIDFGLAKFERAEQGSLFEGFKGKRGYAAPEQFGLFGSAAERRSDLYSLGVVLAEAACCRPLLPQHTLADAIEARRRAPALPRAIPRALRRALAPLLRPDPRQRPADALRALEHWERAAALPRRRRGWLAAAAAACALAVAGARGDWADWRAAAWRWTRPEAPSTAGAAKPASDFAAVRERLLGARPAQPGARAALRVVPNPVSEGEPYRLRIEADCACRALLFAVESGGQRVELLYPNGSDADRPLAPGQPLQLPAGPYELLAEGAPARDELVLIAVAQDLRFPAQPLAELELWEMSPARPERIRELAALLERLQALPWGGARATLQIVR